MKHTSLLLSAALVLASTAAFAIPSISVSPTGDDANDGSAAKPVKTLARALALAREQGAGTPREIVFADGIHRILKAERLGPADSGLVFRAANQGRATLSGAVPVTGWQTDPDDARVLVAPFPFEAKPQYYYMLVANGAAAEFSVYPRNTDANLRYFATGEDIGKNNRKVIDYDPNDIPKGFDLSKLDIGSVFLLLPQEWCSTRAYIATNDWQHNRFVLASPTPFPLGQFNQGYRFFNTRLGLDREGTWMYERAKNRVLYRPRAGETAANLTASVTAGDGLFVLNSVTNVLFSGLVLEGSAVPFQRPKDAPPLVLVSADKSVGIAFEDCEGRFTAGGVAEFFATKDVTMLRSHVHDIGGTGLAIFWFGDVARVENCEFDHTGIFNGGAGIASHVQHLTCVSNHIHHTPGCGAIVWTSHSVFASNHLHHTMSVQRDGGAMYGGQNFSRFFDNYIHDCGDWPGLYNDEGGRDSVYYNNRIEGAWWPTHMHDTYGIVISNNVFTCDGAAMRFSFQGATHSVFRDNIIRTTVPITNDGYLANCDFWGENDIQLRERDGSYKSVGKLTLTRRPEPPKKPFAVVKKPGGGRFAIDRNAEGLFIGGVPGASVAMNFDDEFLHVSGNYEYNKYVSYPGSKNLGETWGENDGIRFFFKDFSVTVFNGKKVVASDPAVGITTSNSTAVLTHSVGDGGSWFSFKVPLARLGLDGKTAIGKSVPFNAVSYNSDHREYKYFTQPVGKDPACGALVFKPFEVDYVGFVDARTRRSNGLCDNPGPLYPQGLATCEPVTEDRPNVRADDIAAGYDVRHVELVGYAQGARDASLQGFMLLPFAGEDLASSPRPSRHMEKACEGARCGAYCVYLERWAMRADLSADKTSAWHKFAYDRGGTLKVLVDAQNVAPAWWRGTNLAAKVTAAESAVKDGVFTGHLRATVNGKTEDLYGAIAFDPKPVAVRELPANGRLGKRYVLEFFLMPVTGAVIARGAVSAKSAAEARTRLGAVPSQAGFAAVQAGYSKAWGAVLKEKFKDAKDARTDCREYFATAIRP